MELFITTAVITSDPKQGIRFPADTFPPSVIQFWHGIPANTEIPPVGLKHEAGHSHPSSVGVQNA
jgi:hypothetical protein